MLSIGLTGGIGSGKSTVATMFARHGVPVIDADAIAKQLVAPGEPALGDIVGAFGQGIVDQSGQLDRNRLRRQVFDNPEARRRLEAIMHPRVRTEIERQLRELHTPYCVIVVPLLIEAKQRNLVDRVLVIDVDEETQVKRVCARSALTETEVRKILAAQLPRVARLQHADDVIANDADLATLQSKVDALHERYRLLAEKRLVPDE